MDFIYLDNSIMTKVFSKKNPLPFEEVCHQIIKKRKFAATHSSLMEFYGITNTSIYKKFDIPSKEINNKINSSTNYINKGALLYKNVSEIYFGHLNKIEEKQFHIYLLEKIEEKETAVEKMTKEGDLPQVNLAFCKSLGEEYKTLTNDLLETWKLNNIICYDFTSNRNFKNLKDVEKEFLSAKLILNLFNIIERRFIPPFYQVFSNISRITNTIKRAKGDEKSQKLRKILDAKYLKMKLQADRMDSELLFLYMFGNAIKGGKPVQCYTMDNCKVMEIRARTSLIIWKTLIDFFKNQMNNNDGVPHKNMYSSLEFNLGVIECVHYNQGKFETKSINLNPYN